LLIWRNLSPLGNLPEKTGEHDRYPFGEFYDHVLDKAHEVGFSGAILPESLGGIGGGIAALCEILLHICEADASPGGIIFHAGIFSETSACGRNADFAQSIIPGASSAKDLLVAFPVYTNPAQTDSLPWRKKRAAITISQGGLNFFVLGNLARQAIIPARLGIWPSYSFSWSISTIKTWGKASLCLRWVARCPAVDVTFSGVHARLIGEENTGRQYFEKVSQEMNAAAAAMNAGILRGVYNEALAYPKSAKQGGRPIVNWSEIGMMLASISVKADVAVMCVHQSCLELEQKNSGYESRMVRDGSAYRRISLRSHKRRHSNSWRIRLHEGLRPGETLPRRTHGRRPLLGTVPSRNLTSSSKATKHKPKIMCEQYD